MHKWWVSLHMPTINVKIISLNLFLLMHKWWVSLHMPTINVKIKLLLCSCPNRLIQTVLDLAIFLVAKYVYGPVYAILGYIHICPKSRQKLFRGTRGLRFHAKVKFVFYQIRIMADRLSLLMFMVGV